ncbi:MAG: CdaR family protein [Lachnospiraceae bacterium]|nr:CdaR family protein [Lachnospiraceae bacterium]
MRRILDALKAILMKDLNWKILSLFIAVALWLMVINIENPIESRTFRVTLTEENLDSLEQNGLVMVASEQYQDISVNIRVRGQRLSLDKLYQRRSEIKAYIDFKKAVTGENNLSIEVSLPSISGSSFQTESITPKNIAVTIDNLSSKDLDIQLVTTGEAKSGYVVSEPSLSAQTVTVSGPEYIMAAVDSVKVTVDITDLESDFNDWPALYAYDANGNVVDGVTLSEKYINVIVPINLSKTVPLKLTATGVPLEGYTVTDILWEPQSLDLMGDAETLNGLNEIILPVVNIENASDDVKASYSIEDILPDGVWVKDYAVNAIEVTIKIERIVERELNYSGENITMTGELKEGMNAEFTAEDGVVRLSGADYILNAIDEATLSGTFDISELSEGEYEIPISFDLPDGIKISGDTPFITVFIKPSDAETSEQ